MKEVDLTISEKKLQDKFIRWLKKYNFPYIKNQSGLRYLPQKDGTLKSYMGQNKFPDITIFLPAGRFIFIELKREDGKLSEDQKEYFAYLKKDWRIGTLILRPSNYNDFIADFSDWLDINYNSTLDWLPEKHGGKHNFSNLLYKKYGAEYEKN